MGEGIKTRRGESKGALAKVIYNYGVYNLENISTWVQGGGYVTFNSDHILIGNTIASSSGSAFFTNPSINLANYSKAYFEVQGVSALYPDVPFGVWLNAPSHYSAYDMTAYTTISSGNTSKTVLELDISSISVNHYVGTSYSTNHTGYSLKIYKIWLQ